MPINNISKAQKNRCAIIIIDMQNDFIAKGAPIECPGGRDIIPNIQKLISWGKENYVPVIYTQEIHRSQKIDFGLELERNEPEHCLEGSKGVEIVDELTPGKEDFVVPKRRYSGFYQTDLEVLLKGLNKDVLILTGAATNVCVYATCLDAQQRDYRTIVVEDGVAGTEKELHKAFLKNIDYVLGDVVNVESLIQTLG